MVASCDMCTLTHKSATTQWTTLVERVIDAASLKHQVVAWIGDVLGDWRRSEDGINGAISAPPLLAIRFPFRDDLTCSLAWC